MLVAALIGIPASFGYGLLALLVGIESAGIPLPGETALLAAAVLAAQGKLSITLVIVVAAAAAIVGDNIGYLLGRSGLRRLLERPGWFEQRRRQLLRDGQEFFARYGGAAVFFGRWISWVRIVVAWLAGAEHMPWARFFLWNALGGISWATSIGLLAYFIGSTTSNILAAFGLVGAAVAVVAVIGYVIRKHVLRPPAA
jgi:membrane protein DedA with SNARE-associated domain